ncbi:MAG: M42 family metallopeptidase [Candidatus Bathyarchaeota archaeon]|nr:M42 family metallopeptidase [Candidatus Bathyarchaeota archaeon]
MSLESNIEKLSNTSGVTGREEAARELMTKLIKPYVDETSEDNLGNLIAIKRGKKSKPKIMLAAHMDEIGLMVKNISKEGFLQFAKMGGIDDRILLAQKVIVHTNKGDLVGIIGSKPPHIQKKEERNKIVTYDNLFIDIGAVNLKAAKKMGVKIGDPISFSVNYQKIGKNIVTGKAFDDRAGCATMIEVFKKLRSRDCNIFAVGTIQEEVGLRGAGTAAFGIAPDFGIALDVTVAGDVPGVKAFESNIKMGKGPALTVSDAGLISHPKVLSILVDTANKNNIPYQLETGLPGTTDAARISLTRQGVPSGTISIPTRYIHSPVGMMDLTDVKNSVKLVIAAINEIQNKF